MRKPKSAGTEQPPTDASLLIQVGTVACVVSAVGMALTSAWISFHAAHPMPIGDHWMTVIEFRDFSAGDYGLADLHKPHNEHRILFPRLLFLADYAFFRGSSSFLIATTYVLTLGHGLFLAWIARRWSRASGRNLWIAMATATFLMISGAQVQNLNWSFQIVFPMVHLSSSLAFYLLARSGASTETGAPQRRTWLLILGSVVFGSIATYSMANGLLVWPILVTLTLVLRMPWRAVAAVALSALLVVGSYLVGFSGIGTSPSLASAEVWLDGVHFLLALLGGPIAQARFGEGYLNVPLLPGPATLPAAIVGAVVLVSMLAAGIRLLSGRDRNPLVVTCVSILGFVLGTTLLITWGRIGMGMSVEYAFQSRYATPVLTAWSAFALLAFHWGAERSFARSGRIAVAASILVLHALLWAKQIPELPHAEGRLGYLENLQNEVLAYGVDSWTAERLWNGRPATTLSALQFLSENRLGIYANADPERPSGLRLRGTELSLKVSGDWGISRRSAWVGVAPPEPGPNGEQWEILGSLVTGDGDSIGRIEIEGFEPSPEGSIHLLVVTGPVTADMSIALLDRRDGSVLGRIDLTEPIPEWEQRRIAVPAGIPANEVVLVAEDGGDGWGQWIAVAMPRLTE